MERNGEAADCENTAGDRRDAQDDNEQTGALKTGELGYMCRNSVIFESKFTGV